MKLTHSFCILCYYMKLLILFRHWCAHMESLGVCFTTLNQKTCTSCLVAQGIPQQRRLYWCKLLPTLLRVRGSMLCKRPMKTALKLYIHIGCTQQCNAIFRVPVNLLKGFEKLSYCIFSKLLIGISPQITPITLCSILR